MATHHAGRVPGDDGEVRDVLGHDGVRAELEAAINKPGGLVLIPKIVGQWAKKDPAAAAAWVFQLPSSPTRDLAIQALGGAVAEKDPQSALNFVQTLIFSTLALMFTIAAIESHHHEEGELGHEGMEAMHDATHPLPAAAH